MPWLFGALLRMPNFGTNLKKLKAQVLSKYTMIRNQYNIELADDLFSMGTCTVLIECNDMHNIQPVTFDVRRGLHFGDIH